MTVDTRVITSSRWVLQDPAHSAKLSIPGLLSAGHCCYLICALSDSLFQLKSEYEPAGDQPAAIVKLVAGLQRGERNQVLLGVTGSGKTFTITGGAERYADRGIIPRTLSYIFSHVSKDTQSKFKVSISYMEIYNESGFDLLDENHASKNLFDLEKV